MSERATRTLETPIEKIPFVIFDYMTGGETMDLEGVAVGAGVKSVDRTGEISMNAGSAYDKRLRKLADIMIVSIGDKTEPGERWNALRNLRSRDYEYVMKQVENAASGIDADTGKA